MISIDIEKSFGNFALSLKFTTSNNRCVIFGPSGSGKSSLLKMIAGFYNPDHGSIKLNDKLFFSSQEKKNLSIQYRNVGYLPQEYTLFPNMKIKENIEYGLKMRKIKDTLGIENLSKKFNIFDCLDKYPNQVSGGQRQRVALARALIINPDILLLDEPFSALDKPIREELRELVAEASHSFNVPVLFVTHDLEEAFVFSEEIVVIRSGRVVEFGEKDKIFNNPSYVESAKLFDFNNIWEVEKTKNKYVELQNGITLVCESVIKNARFCCIKPENIMILRDDVNISDKENKMEVKIKKINLRGRYVNLSTKTKSGILIFINIPPHILHKMSLKEGKAITISLKKGSIIFCKEFER